MKVKYNTVTVDEYLALRQTVGWKKLSKDQANKALSNSLYVVGVYKDDELVAMGRIVGDGAVICYIQDLIVSPKFQRMGLGSVVLNELMEHVEKLREDNTEMMLCLMCAKGREHFYEKYGFTARPTEGLGPGMIIYLNGDE